MANTIKVKRSAVAAKVPTTTDLELGEIAVNTYDGKMYIKKDDGAESVVEIGGTAGSGDVVGPGSSTDNAITRFDGTTGKLIQDSGITIDDNNNSSGTLSQTFADGTAVTVAAGKMWYNDTTGSWNLGMGGGNVTQQVGEELYRYGKASSAITDSPLQLVYKTGVVGASGEITFAPAVSGITDSNQILGCATEDIALNGFGRIATYGVVHNITTDGTAYSETWADNDDIYYNPVTGGLTKTEPVAPNIKLFVGTVINASAGGAGSFIVKLGVGLNLSDIGNVEVTSPTGGQLLSYNQTGGYWSNINLTDGTAISITETTGGAITIDNTGVTSLTGTTNEIDVSASTGAVTLSLPATINANTTGNAATATTLATGRTIALTGDITGTSGAFDGSANLSFSTDITANVVGANELNVTGNGTAGQVLSSDGDGSFSWADSGGLAFDRYEFTATASQTTFAVGVTLNVIEVFSNGLLQKPSVDYNISGTNVVFTSGQPVSTLVTVLVYSTFSVANTYSQSAADALFLTEAEADALFLTEAEADLIYSPIISPVFTGSITATDGWSGTGSSAGPLAGIPQVVTIERGGVGTASAGLAFGNGSTGNGMRMPYAGKITVATLHCTDLNGTWSAYIEKNGTADAAYALSATASNADAGQTQTFAFTFAAGDAINWQQQAVPTGNLTAVISFWIIFD